jgi:Abhydrolase family
VDHEELPRPDPSPAEGSADRLAGLDPVAWTLRRYASAPLRMTFAAGTREETLAWQERLRAKLVDLLGGFPEERTPLEPAVLEVCDRPTYRRTRLLFESRPGLSVAADLLVPKDAADRGPLPTVVCVPGHGRGLDDVAGLARTDGDEDGDDGQRGYQRSFALQAVEHGLAALAIEPLGFGHRRDAATASAGPDAAACQPAAGAALLLGETMIGWRVWDVMRALDLVETRPELDAGRVGCVGISGGGTCTLFAAALDPRIRCAYVSGYLSTFRASIMSISHCIDNYVPGILEWAEMYDVAGLVAPRALFSEAGDQDPIFPVAASRDSYRRVSRVYAALGAEDRVRQEVFEGGHLFHGDGWPFVVGALR